ncbi:MAG: penicillin-binding protein 2 [Alphaproteobacteria bacterium]
MPRENEKQRIFTRRAMVFGGLQLAAFSALTSRLFYLQFMQSEEYTTLSENNRIKLQLIAPQRGRILDRNGMPMVTNNHNYRLFVDYSSLIRETYLASMEKLHSLLPFTEKTFEEIRKKRFSPVTHPSLLRDHLTWEEVSLVELHKLSLPGVFIDMGQIRHYPFAEKFAHLTGYVGAVSEKDLDQEDQPLLRLPDFKIGKNGVEKMLEQELRGTAGLRQLEVNVHGIPVREISRRESIPGKDIRLTIDNRLQEFAADRISDQSASVVAMEVDTGNVLTLTSIPAYDPNSFSKGIGSKEWKSLNADKKSPLMNKSISGQYPPGSTFKMVVGLAALEADIIKPWNTVYCPGHFTLGNHTFKCWKAGGHGTVNFHQAVQQSCDVFFYTVAERMGVERYAEMARRFGLGQHYDIGLPSEKTGIIPDPDWKMRSYGQRWTGGDTINCSIGQGYVLSTPLQLAVMTARMASGRQVTPRLWFNEGEETPVFQPVQVSDVLLEANREAMVAVVNEPAGTAYGSRIHEAHMAFAGKTGTSQVRKITQRGVNQNTLPWEYRHHALFVGFAPWDKPKYAVSVLVEHGGGGASAAAPVASDILRKIQELDGTEKKE